MAGEGVFPKSGGDILYASEVNKFASIPYIYLTGSFTEFSGTTYLSPNAGSIIIPSGLLPNPCFININVVTTKDAASNLVISLSGTGIGNNQMAVGSIVANGACNFTGTIGSPFKGYMNGVYCFALGNNALTRSNNQVITDKNPTLGFELLFGAQNGTNLTVESYEIRIGGKYS